MNGEAPPWREPPPHLRRRRGPAGEPARGAAHNIGNGVTQSQRLRGGFPPYARSVAYRRGAPGAKHRKRCDAKPEAKGRFPALCPFGCRILFASVQHCKER